MVPSLDQRFGSRIGRGLALQRFHHVQHRLVLQAVVLQIVVPAPFLHRRRVLGEVPEFGEPPPDRLALGDGVQVAIGHLVLGRDPLGHLPGAANIGLQPAIGIAHLDAEIRVGVVHLARDRVLHLVVPGRRRPDQHHGCHQRHQLFGHSDTSLSRRIIPRIGPKQSVSRGFFSRKKLPAGGPVCEIRILCGESALGERGEGGNPPMTPPDAAEAPGQLAFPAAFR